MYSRVTLLLLPLFAALTGCHHHFCGGEYPYDSACYHGGCATGGCVDGSCGTPACDSCGDVGGCGPDCLGGLRRMGEAVGISIGQAVTCKAGCGSFYWDEWFSDPPACCDPCDNWGNYHGGAICGGGHHGCGDFGCDTCGESSCSDCLGRGKGVGLLDNFKGRWSDFWGYRYHADCGCGVAHHDAHVGCDCGHAHGGYGGVEVHGMPMHSAHPAPLPAPSSPTPMAPAPSRPPMAPMELEDMKESLPPPSGRAAGKPYYDRAQERSVLK